MLKICAKIVSSKKHVRASRRLSSPSMGCYVRGDKKSMGCFVRGGKSLWDVLSGVSKNGMGCFVPGCFVRPNVIEACTLGICKRKLHFILLYCPASQE